MDKPQLVLIPGLLTDAELWRDQIAALQADVHCIVADITQGATLDEVACAVLSATTASCFSMAGFSLGGYVAQHVMRIAPERVARLALLDTSIFGDTPERTAHRAAVSGAARARGRFNGFGDAMISSYLAPANISNQTMVDRVRLMTTRLGPQVLLRQNSLERRDGRDVLLNLGCPLLVMCGEHDRITPVADHKEIVALSDAPTTFVIVPDAGHLSPIENPSCVTEAISDWLKV